MASNDQTTSNTGSKPCKINIIQLDVGQGDSALIILFYEEEAKTQDQPQQEEKEEELEEDEEEGQQQTRQLQKDFDLKRIRRAEPQRKREAFLIDGGLSYNEENMKEVIKWLKHYDAQVTKLIVTHYDRDHLGAITDILFSENVDVEKYFQNCIIYDPGEPFPSARTNLLEKYIAGCQRKQINRKDQKIRICETISVEKQFLVGKDLIKSADGSQPWEKDSKDFALLCVCQNGWIFKGIGKDPEQIHDLAGINPNPVLENDRGIGFVLFYEKYAFYTAGDISSAMEEKLSDVFKEEKINATVMKLSHHGSRHSTPKSLVSQLQPEIVLCSHGKGNTYGHPHIDTVARVLGAVSDNFKFIVFTNILDSSTCSLEENKSDVDKYFPGLSQTLLGGTSESARGSKEQRKIRNETFLPHGLGHMRVAGVNLQDEKRPQLFKPGHIDIALSKGGKIYVNQHENKRAKYVTLQTVSLKTLYSSLKINSKLDHFEKTAILTNLDYLSDADLQVDSNQDSVECLADYDFGEKDKPLKKLRLVIKKEMETLRLKKATGEIAGMQFESEENLNLKDLKKLVLTCQLPPNSLMRSEVIQDLLSLATKRSDKFLVMLEPILQSDQIEASYTLKCIPFEYGGKSTIMVKFELHPQEISENIRIEGLKFIYKKNFKPGVAFQKDNVNYKRFISCEFCEFQGTIHIKNLALTFSAVISASPFVEFGMRPENLSFPTICNYFGILDEFENLKNYLSLEDIELKGIFITAEKSQDKKALFKHVTEFGLRFTVKMAEKSAIYKNCTFELESHFIRIPSKEITCSLTLLPKSEIRLLALFSQFGISADSLDFEKDLLLTELNISLSLPSKNWVLDFQIENDFKFTIFQRVLSCTHLRGEIQVTDRTTFVHLCIKFLLGEDSVTMDANYENGDWSASASYIQSPNSHADWSFSNASTEKASCGHFKALCKSDQIDCLKETMFKNEKDYFSIKSFSLKLSRHEKKLSFLGSCLVYCHFNIPFIDAEVEGLGSLSLQKEAESPCEFIISAQEMKIILPNLGLQINATFEVQWKDKKNFKICLKDCSTETYKNFEQLCKEIDPDLGLSPEMQKSPIKINWLEFSKEDSNWKAKIDIQILNTTLNSSIFKFGESHKPKYLFCGGMKSCQENLLCILKQQEKEEKQEKEQEQLLKRLLNPNLELTNINISFMKKVLFSFYVKVKLNHVIFKLSDSQANSIILKDVLCSFIKIQDHQAIKALELKTKVDPLLSEQISLMEKPKIKWSLLLRGETDIFSLKCKLSVLVREKEGLYCKGEVTQKGDFLLDLLKKFETDEETNETLAAVCGGVAVLKASVEVYCKRKSMVFRIETNKGNIDLKLEKADGSKSSLGLEVQIDFTEFEFQDLPLPLHSLSLKYSNKPKKSLALLGSFSFEKCELVSPFNKLRKKIFPALSSEVQVGYDLKNKALVTNSIHFAWECEDFFLLEMKSLELSKSQVKFNAEILFPILKNLRLFGFVSFNWKKKKLEGSLGFKTLNLKLFPKVTIKEASIEGVLYPVGTGIKFSATGQIDGYSGNFKIGLGPGTPLPCFELVFPKNFVLCLSTIVDVLLEIKIPPYFDCVKIKPRPESKSQCVEIIFLSLIDIKADFALELFGFFQANFYLEIGFGGIEAKINLNKLSLLKGQIALTDSKSEEGPLAHLCLKPSGCFLKIDCRIYFFGLEFAIFVDLSREGLEVFIPVRLELDKLVKITNDFHLILKPGKQISLSSHFNLRLDLSLPAFTAWGMEIPEINLCGAGVDFDLWLDSDRFIVSGSFEFSFLKKSNYLAFSKLELELCEISEIPKKVAACLARNVSKIFSAIQKGVVEKIRNRVVKLLEDISESVWTFFSDAIESIKDNFYRLFVPEKEEEKEGEFSFFSFFKKAPLELSAVALVFFPILLIWRFLQKNNKRERKERLREERNREQKARIEKNIKKQESLNSMKKPDEKQSNLPEPEPANEEEKEEEEKKKKNEDPVVEAMKEKKMNEALMLSVNQDESFDIFKTKTGIAFNSNILFQAGMEQWEENPNRSYCYLTVLEEHISKLEKSGNISEKKRKANAETMAHIKTCIGEMFLQQKLGWIADSLEESLRLAREYFTQAEAYQQNLFETAFGFYRLHLLELNQNTSLGLDKAGGEFYAQKCRKLIQNNEIKDIYDTAFAESMRNEFVQTFDMPTFRPQPKKSINLLGMDKMVSTFLESLKGDD